MLLPVPLIFLFVVLLPAHLETDGLTNFQSLPFSKLSIHQTLRQMKYENSAALLVWAHIGFVVCVALTMAVVVSKLFGRFQRYFQANRRWCRSSIARRSLQIHGLQERVPCSTAEAILVEQLNALLGLSEQQNDHSQPSDSIASVQVAPNRSRQDALLMERQVVMNKTQALREKAKSQYFCRSDPQSQLDRLSEELNQLDQQLMQISIQSGAELSCGVAFVTFNTEDQAKACLEAKRKASNACKNYRFQFAPEPSDIIWKSLGMVTDSKLWLNAWMVMPAICLLLLGALIMPISLIVAVLQYFNLPSAQVIPAAILAMVNLWLLPSIMYSVALNHGYNKISSLEVYFLRVFSAALVISSFGLPMASQLLGSFLVATSETIESSWAEAQRWIGTSEADAFYTQYLLMCMVGIIVLRPQQRRESAQEAVAEEAEVFLGAGSTGRNAYWMPTRATDTKAYQYAIYTHVFYISCGFGARHPLPLIVGVILSGVKYYSDKVAEFRFFSNPVSQFQVRPRFLRRGGQYVTLSAIKCLALSAIIPEILVGTTLSAYQPLPFSVLMAGTALVVAIMMTIVAWFVFVAPSTADEEKSSHSILYTSQHYDPEMPRDRCGEEMYVRPSNANNAAYDSQFHKAGGSNQWDHL